MCHICELHCATITMTIMLLLLPLLLLLLLCPEDFSLWAQNGITDFQESLKQYLTVEEELMGYSTIIDAHSPSQINATDSNAPFRALQRWSRPPAPTQHTLAYGVPACLLHQTVGKGCKASSPNPECLARCLAQGKHGIG